MKIKFTIFETNGNVYSITTGEEKAFTVGRSTGSDIRVRDQNVSRTHCIIEISGSRVFVRDENSANGIFLGNTRVSFAELKNQDVIRVGKSRISVAMDDVVDRVTVMHPSTSKLLDQDNICADCGMEITAEDLKTRRAHISGNIALCNKCFLKRKNPYIGKTLSGCRIEEQAGTGSSCEVYRAVQLSMKRVVAIKVLKPHLSSEGTILQKFLREARTLADLNHPNIMHVYDLGEEDNVYYMIMEYVPGKTVHQLIVDKGRLRTLETVAICIQIARALDYAFNKGIVHRDIKPANIIITPKGETKLMDFGLAKSFRTAGDTGITMPGEGLGTPNYMPPEQVEDAVNADQRSDIYSLGASMYHMIAGTYPYGDVGVYDLLKKILTEYPVSLKEHELQVEPYISEIVEKAMQKVPDARFQTPAEMLDALTIALEKLRKKHRASPRGRSPQSRRE